MNDAGGNDYEDDDEWNCFCTFDRSRMVVENEKLKENEGAIFGALVDGDALISLFWGSNVFGFHSGCFEC